MKTTIRFLDALAYAALAFIIALGTTAHIGCTSTTPGAGGATTQPAFDASSLIPLALADYETLVASGLVKQTPALDAAVKAVFVAQADYAAGKGTVVAINDAGMQLAVALAKAKTGK